ncbi:uncharacterized protein LOC126804334 [Argentina anserina]|uniref:uncharacterized protein LOC126804334 n=1 Tax=Argentina anserina TaxID=57926 RepID=UPI00217623D5|nr:uncharacterized protein LOC126804334 [Potentilla anserina]
MDKDKSWIHLPKESIEYQQGVLDFLQFVHEHGDGKKQHRCPCLKCLNTKWKTIKKMYDHLSNNGIMRSYTTWSKHGEVADHEPTYDRTSGGSFEPDHLNPAINILHDSFPTFAPTHEEDAIYDTTTDTVHVLPYTNTHDYDKYTRLLARVQIPLYDGSPQTVLGTILSQMQLKVKNRWSNEAFDNMLKNVKNMLPQPNNLPDSYYKVHKILGDLGLGYDKIHACKNDCVLFYKTRAELDECPICFESRWKEGTVKENSVPVKVLRHFPLIPRLKRLYMSRHTSSEMRWHGERRVDDDTLRHPADGEAWKTFDRSFPDFAADVRNVRLGLATDGFNPFGSMSLAHSTWPVILVPYNLPPWMCMKKEFSMMSLLIPGPKSPGKCLDVYMEPLIDELLKLWENGVLTFDRHSGSSFIMRAAVMWTISDFPGYGMLSSQAVHGYKACPVCLNEVHSDWHAGKVCYLGHRRWLPIDHSWRQDVEGFDGTVEFRTKPRVWSGDEILEMLNSFDFGVLSGDPAITGTTRPDDMMCFTHKSRFYDLPYWSKSVLRHALDVMHIEGNVANIIMGTTLSLKYGNKDTVKAREDLKKLRIREHLWPIKKGSVTKLPLAPYTVHPTLKRHVFTWFKGVKYPHGYAGNISRCIRERENKFCGLKTHDCHVLLQRLLPVIIRPYLHPDVVEPIIALCRFFQKLCAKELKKSEVLILKEDIVYILCKLERVFPPAFFVIMIHLMVHLPEQILLSGPVHCTWMYPQERQLGQYKRLCKSKSNPEGSIAESYIADECVIYCNLYLQNSDGAESSTMASTRQHFNLSVVSGEVRHFGTLPNFERLSDPELAEAHWCVLQHCKEAQYFLDEHLKLIKANPRDRRPNVTHKRKFPDYFLTWMRSLRQQNSEWCTPELYHLACKPKHHSVHAGCFVNGVKFVTLQRDINHKTQNYGVMVHGDNFPYYGVLLAVVELMYGNMSVVLFKCKWFNTNPNVPRSTKMDYGMLSVNTETSWYDTEPFILATMAKQVFYLDDPKAGPPWKVVNFMSHRNIWSETTLSGGEELDDEEDNDEVHEPYQEPSPSQICGLDDIRINNHLHFVQGDQFITIPNESTSQNRQGDHGAIDEGNYASEDDIFNESYTTESEANDTEDEDWNEDN